MAGDSEVTQFDDTLATDEDIRRLHVSVDYFDAIQVVKSFNDTGRDSPQYLFGNGVAFEWLVGRPFEGQAIEFV